MKETFHIFGGGDSSVGIPATEATIIIDDNFNDDKYDKLTMIKTWKEFLHEYYDNGNITILTDKEFDDRCIEQTEGMNCEQI